MSPFSDGAFALHCRVCEDMTLPEPLEICRRCDGATDIAYDWEHLRGTVTAATIAAGPPSLWLAGGACMRQVAKVIPGEYTHQ